MKIADYAIEHPAVIGILLIALALFGVVALMITMSVYLARQFGYAHRQVEAQLAEVQRLSDDLRRANEQLTEYSHTLEERVAARQQGSLTRPRQPAPQTGRQDCARSISARPGRPRSRRGA